MIVPFLRYISLVAASFVQIEMILLILEQVILPYTMGSIFQKKREILDQHHCPSRLVSCATQLTSPETPDEDIQENESMLYAKYTS